MQVLLEIVKITVPSLIVFLTVFMVMKQYLEKERHREVLKFRQNQQKVALPLRLQAYERLSLLCERISLPNMMMRIRQNSMSVVDLQMAMMIALQQEFDHNIAQQIYVSPDLWEIVKLARNDAANTISSIASQLEPNANSQELSAAIIDHLSKQEVLFLDKAQLAIKKEVSMLL